MSKPASYAIESCAYANGVIVSSAINLRTSVEAGAADVHPAFEVETKTDALGRKSPVTKYDRATEVFIASHYQGTSVRIKGEEGQSSWSGDIVATLDLHVDPIDGTELFTEYLDELVAWHKLPEHSRPAHPICGAMVSLGGVRPNSPAPEWGTVAAPFLSSDGIVRWTTDTEAPAVRIDPNGSRSVLPMATAIARPETGGIVMLASDTTEQLYGDVLQKAGYRTVKYRSAVACALSLMDPRLFEQLSPDITDGEPVVGTVMNSAKNWDVAAVTALAHQLGYFASDIQGQPRGFEDGKTSAIFAASETIGHMLVRTIAPAVPHPQ